MLSSSLTTQVLGENKSLDFANCVFFYAQLNAMSNFYLICYQFSCDEHISYSHSVIKLSRFGKQGALQVKTN